MPDESVNDLWVRKYHFPGSMGDFRTIDEEMYFDWYYEVHAKMSFADMIDLQERLEQEDR